MEKSNKELALEWWSTLTYAEKNKYRGELSRYSSMDSPVDPVHSADEDIVQEIWESENPILSLSDDMININFDGIEEEHKSF